ncbi:MAG: hypothetical protein FWB95_03375 [Treponema sp.]|nr:hypothetical protein [Treponema sp.]
MRKIILMLFFSFAGAALNIFLNRIFAVSGIGLPLYLDTILTIAVTLIGGLFWGCLTGALTNIAGHTLNFWGWEGYLFMLCSIVTAVITWKFIRIFPVELNFSGNKKSSDILNYSKSRQLEKVMNNFFVLTLLSFVLCFAMSILGGLISFLINILRAQTEGSAVFNPASQPSGFYSGLPLILREIISRIPINIIDRIISVFAGFTIAWVAGKIIKKFKKPSSATSSS